jgi:ATP synthase protein I
LNPDDLEDRIAKARASGTRRGHGPADAGQDAESGRALGAGLRIGIEFVSAIAVGAGLGLAVDHWLGTRPFGLLILLLLGFGTALMNVWRTLGGADVSPVRATERADSGLSGLEKDREEDHAEPS